MIEFGFRILHFPDSEYQSVHNVVILEGKNYIHTFNT